MKIKMKGFRKINFLKFKMEKEKVLQMFKWLTAFTRKMNKKAQSNH